MQAMPAGLVNTCVTSPPYYGLRDYGMDGQIGLEKSPEEYVAKMVAVFREVKRLRRDDGTVFLDLGDSYAGGGGCSAEAPSSIESKSGKYGNQGALKAGGIKPVGFIKSKDLIGIPWMLAFALRADGWFLRQEIIWNKPNPMPESVTERCTKSHESIFLLSKQPQYYFDAEAIKEPVAASSLRRYDQDIEGQQGSDRVPGKTNGAMKAVGGGPRFKGNRKTFRGGGVYTGGQSFNNSSDANNESVGNTSTMAQETATEERFGTDGQASPVRSMRDSFKRTGSKRQLAQAQGLGLVRTRRSFLPLAC